jgi:hypothetical protein
MMKYLLALFVLSFSMCFKSTAQNSVADVTGKVLINSPNAGAFTQYSKVPVSLFTGIADISVPIFDIKVDNLSVPIYLSYYARGIQPNTHAGWVGTGWNLFAGSAITRKINGAPDEWVIPYSFGGYTQGAGIGWFYQHSSLNNPNWASLDSITNYTGGIAIDASAVRDAAPDEFDFTIGGISGAFFLGEDGIWKVRTNNGENVKVQVISPGQYQFTSNAKIGGLPTLVGNTFTQFILTTGDGTKYSYGGDSNAIEFNRAGVFYSPYNTNVLAMSWHLKQIMLPSGKIIDFEYFRDGNEYAYNPNSRSGLYQISAGPQPSFIAYFNNGSVTMTSAITVYHDVNVNITDPVYLSSISFPEGKLIFHSAPSGELDVLDDPYVGFCSINQDCSSFPGYTFFASVMSGYYNELTPTGQSGLLRPPSKWYQLNDVELDDYNGNKIKDVKLTYSQDANTRLQLNSVQTTGYYNNPGLSEPPYTFVYNSTPLPKYCTDQTDHWGFYTGPASIHPYPTITLDATGFPDNTSQTNYTNYREPNFTYTQAGILTQINYPTGGFSQFQYEANQYIKWVGLFPPTVTTLSQSAIGGGLRIKTIISQASASSSPITYTYNYVNDLTNNVSSGVLGMQRPTYFDANSLSVYEGNEGILIPLGTYANITYKYWNSTAVFPSQNDDGNIVTYSNVIERQSSNGTYNGMKIVNFSNHDNGYLNNPPDAAFWMTANSMQFYHYSDRSFERGLILSETYLDNANDTLRKLQYSYNNDPNRFNSFVKSILSDSRIIDLSYYLPPAPTEQEFYSDPEYSGIPVTGQLNFFRTSAIRMYTFYPFLQQTVETDYPSDHSINQIVTTTNYTYDPVDGTRNLIKKTTNDSKGELVITNTHYAADLFPNGQTDPFSLGIQNMQNLYAIELPVEQYIQKSNSDGSNLRTISSLLKTYDQFQPQPDLIAKSEILTPLTNFTPAFIGGSGLIQDPSYQPKIYVDRYDQVGNILQQHELSDVNQSYQWGYNSEHPVAKIINAMNNYQNYYSYTPSIQNVPFVFVPNNYTNQTQYFSVFSAGTITLTIGFGGNPGQNTTANVSYQLVGPTDQIGQLCTNGCTTQNSISFINMPVGGYSLTIIPNINNSLANVDVNCSYPGFTAQQHISGTKEFFYESFEENPLGVPVPSGLTKGFTGNKVFYNGLYKVPFARPDGRSYTISYFLNGQLNLSPFTTDSMTINATGAALDEVRVYPSDAQMTTYTYTPLIGMTSMNDPNNKVTYFEYDGLSRLKNIKDYQGNIIKNYQYNFVSSCGTNCYVLPMQTFNGSNTLSYPVGVFSVNGQLIGNATTQGQYDSLWNGNSSNQLIGSITAGADLFHFNLTVLNGQTPPAALIGCRYYQYDLNCSQIDGIMNTNGCFVDFGDGAKMRLGKSKYDTVGIVLAPHTVMSLFAQPYFIHTYADTTLKTITLYHNDLYESPFDDNRYNPATSLTKLKNLRGYCPQGDTFFGGSCLQQASALTTSGLINWNSINTVRLWIMNPGDGGINPAMHMSYPQDFMQNSPGLLYIITTAADPYQAGYRDTSFKISRLKSNWNTYFTQLSALAINDDHWNREDISALTHLSNLTIVCTNQNHSNVSAGNSLTPIPSSTIDNILNQVSAGAGLQIYNGTINIISGGTARTTASNTSVTSLKAKGWNITVNAVLQ